MNASPPEESSLQVLMAYAPAGDGGPGGDGEDAQVKGQGAALQVFDVELHLLRDRQLVAAVDLSPPGQARPELVDAAGGANGVATRCPCAS